MVYIGVVLEGQLVVYTNSDDCVYKLYRILCMHLYFAFIHVMFSMIIFIWSDYTKLKVSPQVNFFVRGNVLKRLHLVFWCREQIEKHISLLQELVDILRYQSPKLLNSIC